MTAAQYLSQLQALLPQGAAWPRDAGSVQTNTLLALADEMARLDLRIEQLLDEIDPRVTSELLADWERVAGLPEDCVTAPQTAQERRSALVAALVNRGGQHRDFYIAIALALGYVVTITEFPPFVAGSSAGGSLTNGPWTHAWRINGPVVTIRTFRVGKSRVGEALREWNNQLLECVLKLIRPAHSVLQFAYAT